MKASQTWFWAGSHYHIGIKIDDKRIVDMTNGEICFTDEIMSQATVDEVEPFLVLKENGEWVELS